jgi:hypothetical protein
MGKNVDFQNNIHIRQIKQICKPKDIYHIIFDENNNFGWSKLVGNPLDLITSEELAIQLVNKYTELIIEDKPINIAPKIRITFPNNSRNSY